MTGKDDGPDRGATGQANRYDAQEEVMLREGRRLSTWALIGAVAFVCVMIVLALAVFKSGGPNPVGGG